MPLVIPPYGVSPLGAFAPTTYSRTPAPPPGVLADAIDPQTKEITSLTTGLHPIDEQVLTALTVVRASGAAVADDGSRFVDITKLDQNSKVALEAEARIALKRLVERQDILLLGVVVETDDDWAEATVQWRNLRARNVTQVRSTKFRTFNVAGSLRS